MGYRFTCLSCQGTYEGETARLLKVRAMEHINDLAKKKIQSRLVKHIDQCHPQENIKFKITQTGIFFDICWTCVGSHQIDIGFIWD